MKIKTLGLIGSIASILGFATYFIDSSPGKAYLSKNSIQHQNIPNNNGTVIINNYNSSEISHQREDLSEINSDFGKIKLKTKDEDIKAYQDLSYIKIIQSSDDSFGKIIEQKSPKLIPSDGKF